MTRMFINNVASELAANVAAGDTVIQILDPTSFPPAVNPGELFIVTMENRATGDVEIVEVTSIVGDLLTIVRAQEGTTAKDFSAFDLVQSRLTAAPLNEFQDEIANRVPQTNATGAAVIPAGTTAQRPTPFAGYFRFNLEMNRFEGFNGTSWGGVAGASISETPPADAAPGDLWWANDIGTLLVYYDDGNSAQWVSTTPSFAGALYMPISGGAFEGPVSFPFPTNFSATATFSDLQAVAATITTLGVTTANVTTANITDANLANANVTTLNVSGVSTLGKTAVDANGNIYVGGGQVADAASFIDLNSVPGGTYEARWNRAAGANGATQLLHKGTGAFQFVLETAGALFQWFAGGAARMSLAADALSVAVKATFATPGVNSTAADTNAQVVVSANGASGDADVAAVALVCPSLYGLKMYVRGDGYWGIGGYSRAAWGLYLDPSNNLVATGNVTSASDPRLKDNVEKIADPYDLIANVHGYFFTWNNRSSLYANKAGKSDIGFLSSEVKRTMPEIISQTIEDPDTGEVYDTVCYEKVVPVLVEIIHDLKARITALEAKGR